MHPPTNFWHCPNERMYVEDPIVHGIPMLRALFSPLSQESLEIVIPALANDMLFHISHSTHLPEKGVLCFPEATVFLKDYIFDAISTILIGSIITQGLMI
jgi:hypothetical protein